MESNQLMEVAGALGVTAERAAQCAGVSVETFESMKESEVVEALYAVLCATRLRGEPTGPVDTAICCSPTRPHLTLCRAMQARVQSGMGRAKGLRESQLVHIPTCTNTRGFVSYHDSSSDKGLILNFCPWCGGRIAGAVEDNSMVGRESAGGGE